MSRGLLDKGPLGRVRLLTVYLLVGVLLYFSQPTPLSVAAGATLLALGEAVRFWAAGHLLKTQELVTSGPYRFVRNPLYLGRLLIFSGLSVMVRLPYAGSWIVLILGWGVFFGNYMRRKERVEPARLAELHGEAFDRYFRQVPALFPYRRPYRDTSGRRWAGERFLRNREQWMVTTLVLIVAFLAWRASLLPL